MNQLRDEKSLGRPTLSNKQKDLIFHKVEPYLKAGLSLHKACLQAQLPPSTIYDHYSENKEKRLLLRYLLTLFHYHQ